MYFITVGSNSQHILGPQIDITLLMAVTTPGEIFSRRLTAAAACSVIVQIVFSSALVLALRFDMLHPGSWLMKSATALVTLKLLPLCFVTLAQAFVFGRSCAVPPPVRFSRFYTLLDMFTLHNVAYSILYALSGYFTFGFFASLTNGRYANLRKICEKSDGQCLVEESLFLECGAIWMGLYFFLKTHIFGSTLLLFPHVHQEKIHQIRGTMFSNVIKSFMDSMRPTLYFIIFYTIWGHKPRNVVKDIYSLYLEDDPLDNVLNLLGSGVWLNLWLYSSLFFVTMYNMRTVFNIFLTEPMKFPVNSTVTLALHEAMAQRWRYNGFLAAQDFRILAFSDLQRRQEIFTVSQPGGHPRTWNNVLHQCLDTINGFNKQLEIINDSLKPAQSDGLSMANITSYSYPAPSNIRNMAASPDLLALKDHNRNKVEDTLTSTVKTALQNQLGKLLQKPVIGYFFREQTDRKLKSLLLRAQTVSWTCEGLAFITAASLREDQYGIVQNDLPTIIGALIDVKQSLEKLTKSGSIPKRQVLSDALAVKMKNALLSSIKRSIYKITHTFAKYMDDIPLSPDLQQAVQPFISFKEC